MTLKILSRRWFLKTVSLASMTFWGAIGRLWPQSSGSEEVPAVELTKLIAALGDTLIPSAPGYPGYRSHSQMSTTVDVYTHVSEEEVREAAEVLARAISCPP